MNLFKTSLLTLAAATSIALPATLAHAGLSEGDKNYIDGRSGIQVVASDGTVVGVSNGISVRGDRVRLFLVQRGGRVFRSRGKKVNITTKIDNVDLSGNVLTLNASRQKLRLAGTTFPGDTNSDPIEVYLFGRH